MKKSYWLLFLMINLLFSTCEKSEDKQKQFNWAGLWRFELIRKDVNIPFIMRLEKKNNRWLAQLINGEERIVLDSVHIDHDSIHIPLHIFDAQIVGKFHQQSIEGVWQRQNDASKSVSLLAKKIKNKSERFIASQCKNVISGLWTSTFTRPDGSTYEAIGKFEQNDGFVSGTFRKETGDYRYLTGTCTPKGFQMSTFDGTHAYLFTAELIHPDTISGQFYSGQSTHITWKAYRNPKAELRDPGKLTFLKEGENQLYFSLPDLNGNKVSSEDASFKNKVLIVQIMGSWCPNCMDETVFFTEWLEKNPDKNVEIIALAFEQKADFDYAKKRIIKLKEKLGAPYTFLIGGDNSKENIAQKLPTLEQLKSFPTTFFINKKGEVAYIHTGFNGPATGIYYTQWKSKFSELITDLLKE